MGNAGDFIKHGLLAEFVKWYKSDKGGSVLRFADTFGGCPRESMHSTVRDRLNKLEGTTLHNAYSEGTENYLGSSHLVHQVAKDCKLKTEIYISDRDPNARRNWADSIVGKNSMSVIELPHDNDGYAVLYGDYPAQYDLILIDPYSEFLCNEFYKNDGKHFPVIWELANAHPNLFVAVFVLDKVRTNRIGDRFSEFKKNHLFDRAFSLRCPTIGKKCRACARNEHGIRGESGCDSEILLISQQIAKGECDDLYARLRAFAEKAAKALPLSDGKKLELWSAKQKGTPDEPESFSHE